MGEVTQPAHHPPQLNTINREQDRGDHQVVAVLGLIDEHMPAHWPGPLIPGSSRRYKVERDTPTTDATSTSGVPSAIIRSACLAAPGVVDQDRQVEQGVVGLPLLVWSGCGAAVDVSQTAVFHERANETARPTLPWLGNGRDVRVVSGWRYSWERGVGAAGQFGLLNM